MIIVHLPQQKKPEQSNLSRASLFNPTSDQRRKYQDYPDVFRYLGNDAYYLPRHQLREMHLKIQDYPDVFRYAGADGFNHPRHILRDMHLKVKDYPDVFEKIGARGFDLTRHELRDLHLNNRNNMGL